MGYIRHHAIIVTSWDEKAIRKARKKAKEIFDDLVTRATESKVNGFYTFLICPDGSKEGWEESDMGDAGRKAFIKWIKSNADEDGGNSISYTEVFYGDDNGQSKVVSHN